LLKLGHPAAEPTQLGALVSAELVAARRGGALLLPCGVDPVTQGLMVNAQLTGDLPQRPVRREDQLYGVLTELLGVVRGTGHLNTQRRCQNKIKWTAMWWQSAATKVKAWKNSWWPKTAGHGFGRRSA